MKREEKKKIKKFVKKWYNATPWTRPFIDNIKIMSLARAVFGVWDNKLLGICYIVSLI